MIKVKGIKIEMKGVGTMSTHLVNGCALETLSLGLLEKMQARIKECIDAKLPKVPSKKK